MDTFDRRFNQKITTIVSHGIHGFDQLVDVPEDIHILLLRRDAKLRSFIEADMSAKILHGYGDRLAKIAIGRAAEANASVFRAHNLRSTIPSSAHILVIVWIASERYIAVNS